MRQKDFASRLTIIVLRLSRGNGFRCPRAGVSPTDAGKNWLAADEKRSFTMLFPPTACAKQPKARNKATQSFLAIGGTKDRPLRASAADADPLSGTPCPRRRVRSRQHRRVLRRSVCVARRPYRACPQSWPTRESLRTRFPSRKWRPEQPRDRGRP